MKTRLFNGDVPYIGHINPATEVKPGVLVIANKVVFEVIEVQPIYNYTDTYTKEARTFVQYKCKRSKLQLGDFSHFRINTLLDITLAEVRDENGFYYLKVDEVIVPPQEMFAAIEQRRAERKEKIERNRLERQQSIANLPEVIEEPASQAPKLSIFGLFRRVINKLKL